MSVIDWCNKFRHNVCKALYHTGWRLLQWNNINHSVWYLQSTHYFVWMRISQITLANLLNNVYTKHQHVISNTDFRVLESGKFVHYSDVIKSVLASQITRVPFVCSRFFRRRSKKTPKLRVTALCERNPPMTGGFPSERASNAEEMFPFDDVFMHRFDFKKLLRHIYGWSFISFYNQTYCHWP